MTQITTSSSAVTTSKGNVFAIPSLADLPLAVVPSSFAAFKAEEAISFVRQYDPRVQGIPGMRHAVIRYRNTDKKIAEKTAQMVTIPQIALNDDYLLPEQAAKVLLGIIEDEQDNMIRSMIDTGASVIHWANLTLEMTLASLTAIRVSSRLSKEQIEGWAKIALVPACNQRADQVSEAKSYNADQQAKQRAGTLNAYCELICKLAAPVPNIGQEQATAAKNLLLVSKLDDDMAKVLLNKLDAILNPKVLSGGEYL